MFEFIKQLDGVAVQEHEAFTQPRCVHLVEISLLLEKVLQVLLDYLFILRLELIETPLEKFESALA